MENPAFACQFLLRLMQVDWIDLSQAPLSGWHCQIDKAEAIDI